MKHSARIGLKSLALTTVFIYTVIVLSMAVLCANAVPKFTFDPLATNSQEVAAPDPVMLVSNTPPPEAPVPAVPIKSTLATATAQQPKYPFESPTAASNTNNLHLPAAANNSTAESGGTNHVEEIVLREGDVLKISVPSTPSLSGTHTIRRDGNITLETIGDIRAAGKTLDALRSDLINAIAAKYDTKEVNVELASATFPVFITGAVMRPGKIESNHPLTALEAVMESGGPDYTKANLKNVKISRLENGRYKSFEINLKDILEGKKTEPFYLKPQDILFIPERFIWF